MNGIYDLCSLLALPPQSVPVAGVVAGAMADKTYLYGSFGKKTCLACFIKRIKSSAWVDADEYVPVPARATAALARAAGNRRTAVAGMLYHGRITAGGGFAVSSATACLPVPGCVECHGKSKKNG